MNSRMKLFEILAAAKGKFVSGAELTNSMGLSRQAVSKLTGALRDEGAEIEAVPHSGYRLAHVKDSDRMGQTLLNYLLRDSGIFNSCLYIPEVDSTQQTAKKLAAEDAPEGIVVVADTQTSGRGRRGRVWKDTFGKNIIFSALLRPELKPGDVQLLNLAAGLAVCETLRDVCGVPAELKWPNDTLVNNKKICGILSEAAGEADRIYYAVTGVGINVNMSADDVAPELRDTATSVLIETGRLTPRPALLARVLQRFSYYIMALNGPDGVQWLINYYRGHCGTIGKEVRVIQDEKEFTGTALGVTRQGALIVNCGGREMVFAAADVQHLR